MKFVYSFLAGINLIGFLLMGADKLKARRGSWRVQEQTIFLISLVGGAIGVYMGMKIFRHKTKHYSFAVGIPLLIVLNIFVVYYLLRNLD